MISRSIHCILAALVLMALYAGETSPGVNAAPAQQSTAVDLMLVVDGSASISPADFELARTFAKQVAASCVLGIDARVGAVQFSDEGITQLVTGLTSDSNAVVAALNRMRQIRGNTDIQEGLQRAQAQIATNGRANAKHFIVLLTDGQQNEDGDEVAQANQIRQAGTNIFAVGVGSQVSPDALRAIASDPDSTYFFPVANFGNLADVLTALLGTSCPGASVLQPNDPKVVGSAADRSTKPANISVVVRPSINTTVPRATTLTYTVVVANRGKGPASNVRITMPLNPATTRVLDVQTSRSTFFVSAADDDTLVMQTGRLSSRSDVVTATVLLQTQDGAADNALVSDRLVFSYGDNTGGSNGRSNAPILTIGSSVIDQPTYALVVEPASGSAGSTHTFRSAIFAPGEPVTLWYNMPDGSIQSAGMVRANSEGAIGMQFTTTKLASGSYSMVARGEYTQFTAAGTFLVE